ncbi:protein MIS12 homolog isoform X2 [Magnolia sinica]|uniref:protein MIS12 homolog isoform X2 n=1 Tax=Magnolia sinica TaxID=86752 RepID=UPI002659D812|nr:protein MIS12 homolog isoform X2 [Magnolia sinica]
MEGSESEAVFDSFNLNPQLFINEVLNAVDDMVDGAFDFYEQQASELLGNMGSDRSGELNRDSSGNSLLLEDVLSDAELDAQLDSLREKLVVVGRESAELHRELHALQKQSILSSSCARSVAEALEPFKQNSTHDMFKEMLRTASELRAKMEIMKAKRREEMERIRIERIYNPDKSQSMMYSNGLSASLEDLQEFADDMTKKM